MCLALDVPFCKMLFVLSADLPYRLSVQEKNIESDTKAIGLIAFIFIYVTIIKRWFNTERGGPKRGTKPFDPRLTNKALINYGKRII